MANDLPSWHTETRSSVPSSTKSTPASLNPILSASAGPVKQGSECVAASRASFRRAEHAPGYGAERAPEGYKWSPADCSPNLQNLPFKGTQFACFAEEVVGSPSVQSMPLLEMVNKSLPQEAVASPLVPLMAVSYSMEDTYAQSGAQRMPFITTSGGAHVRVEGADSPSGVQNMPFITARSGAHVKVEIAHSPSGVQNMPLGPMSSGRKDVDMSAGEAGPSAAAPPPFLTKTFDMVEDPSCDSIISWSAGNNSFVVWDPNAFSCELLPGFFRHNNFASFVRHLMNTYGFRKVHPNRWEFANEGFLRGQRHLLKGIQRKKPVLTTRQQPLLAAGCPRLEAGKYGSMQAELESLQRDRNWLMLEVVRLRQQQQSTEQKVTMLSKRLQSFEQRQQKLVAVFAKALQNRSLMAQLVQKNEQAICLHPTRKRRLPRVWSSFMEDVSAPLSEGLKDGQLPDYCNGFHTSVIEELEALLQEMEPNQINGEGVRETIVAGQDGCEALREMIVAVQDGCEAFMTKKYDDGEGNLTARSVVKQETPDSYLGIPNYSDG